MIQKCPKQEYSELEFDSSDPWHKVCSGKRKDEADFST